MAKTIHQGNISGIVVTPPSKSDSQRAILSAALAKGTSTLINVGSSDDEKAMVFALQKLGVQVEVSADQKIRLNGISIFPDYCHLNLQESGLGSRLITCILAAQKGEFIIEGEGSLLKRPMYFFEPTFKEMGVDFQSENGHLPFKIKGPINTGNYSIDGAQSSQYVSGLLMAMPLLNGNSRLTVKTMNSEPYIQMTIRTLEKFGIQIEKEENVFKIMGNQQYLPCEYRIEGDWSAASYWLVSSALGQHVSVSGLQMNSLQADKAILIAFVNANCRVFVERDGIRIDGSAKKAFSFDATHCPDLFPALVCFASFLDGITSLKGLSRLKDKESDRGLALKEEFEKLGVTIDLVGDKMLVYGSESVKGARVNSHGDHRIAMCLAIAGIFAEGHTEISNPEVVSKSYPDFWKQLNSLIEPKENL